MPIIDITNSKAIEIPFISDELAREFSLDNKGWSLSSVYHFTEIRDVYLAFKEYPIQDNKKFTSYCIEIKLPFVKTPWNARRILEHLNALKNFRLLSNNYEIILEQDFNTKIGDPLSDEDLDVFRKIFFSYFRFKELMSWFVDIEHQQKDKLIEEINEDLISTSSRPLFCFSDKSRFTDSFFYDLNDTDYIFFIDYKKNEDLMRFWDVFVKWASSLNLIEKFSLKSVGYRLENVKFTSGLYFINPMAKISETEILEFIMSNFNSNYIYIPELVLKISLVYRVKVDIVKDLIIDLYLNNKDSYSLERTSEVFIKASEFKNNEVVFFPKYKDSFISHLIVRR